MFEWDEVQRTPGPEKLSNRTVLTPLLLGGVPVTLEIKRKLSISKENTVFSKIMHERREG